MNDMSLKAKIRNLAVSKNMAPQSTMQLYLMNRFLFRLSKSEYTDKYIIKGGVLISSIVGIENRATMDIDATVKNMALDPKSIRKSFETICNVKTDDNISFTVESISAIRDDDEYGGYRVSFYAHFGKINAPMSMDVTTGDIVTPGAKRNTFKDVITHEEFELWSYPIETILAEKVECILNRGIENTRPRDFYDVLLLSGCNYDKDVFKKALAATAEHRGNPLVAEDYENTVKAIGEDKQMNLRWKTYSERYSYANGILFSETLKAITELMR